METSKIRLLLVTTGDNEVRRYLQKRYPDVVIVDCRHMDKRSVINTLTVLCRDVLITYRCPYILPLSCFGKYTLGGYNIHPTLLPKYPGLNPWEEIFRNREKEGGVTVHRLSEKVDGGEICMQRAFCIMPDDTIESARDRADKLAARMMKDFLTELENNFFNIHTMKSEISKLSGLFKAMVDNYHTFGAMWKNIELGKQAFTLMKSLPSTLKGEFDTPADKAFLLSRMLELMDETSTPRFCIEVREYIKSLNHDDGENIKMLAMLKDYIDTGLTMEEYCARYRKHLKFDPVQRSRKWEDVIYYVEKECDEILEGESRGMGFCYMYWSVKEEVLERYGIDDWKSPSEMNPTVRFD